MPIDRDDTLKRAEKLLRQGRLDAAIAEYARVANEYPRDWNTINLLGDLYARAGRAELAADQFTRIADHLAAEGFHAKASALYKKALKVRPDVEHVLLQLGNIAARQSLVADARQYLGAVAERRRSRGDRTGVAQILVTLAALDPDDVEAQVLAGRAAFEAGDAATGRRVLGEAAADYESRGRFAVAVAVLEEALRHDPQNAALRARMTQALVAQGDPVRARPFASRPEELDAIAGLFESAGQGEAAIEAWDEAVRLAPDDMGRRRRLVQALAAQGRTEQLTAYLTAETAGEDPELLRAFAIMELRAGRIDSGRAALRHVSEGGTSARMQLVADACALAREQADVGFACLDAAVDASTGCLDYEEAVAALREFLAHAPGHLAALMKLVEVCVDGGLESTMFEAQAQLADAYLAASFAAEARVVAEDLVSREPGNAEHVARLRRALDLCGEADPDGVIRERLAAGSSLDSLDVPERFDVAAAPDGTEGCAAEPSAAEARRRGVEDEPGAATWPVEDTQGGGGAGDSSPGDTIELHALEIDLNALLAELEGAAPVPSPAGDRSPVAPPVLVPAEQTGPFEPPPSLEAVFESFREEAARGTRGDAAAEQHERGIRLLQQGRFEEGVAALEAAAHAPQFRFAAAARLGRAWLARGDHARGIEWLERAVDAPAATPQESLALLYDLGDALERAGETARALAVFLELGAQAPAFRDVQARTDRLARAQARG